MATFYNSYFKKGHIKAQRRISRSGQQGKDGKSKKKSDGGGVVFAEMSQYNM